jgi:hypothetical protein
MDQGFQIMGFPAPDGGKPSQEAIARAVTIMQYAVHIKTGFLRLAAENPGAIVQLSHRTCDAMDALTGSSSGRAVWETGMGLANMVLAFSRLASEDTEGMVAEAAISPATGYTPTQADIIDALIQAIGLVAKDLMDMEKSKGVPTAKTLPAGGDDTFTQLYNSL